MNTAVYNFLGYVLTDAKIKRNLSKKNSYISINVFNENINRENKQYNFLVKVAMDLADEESYFIFEVGFSINDFNWFDSLPRTSIKSIFFSAVFPFIREKIFSITSDLMPGIFIPVLDLRNVDLNNEFRLIKSKI